MTRPEMLNRLHSHTAELAQPVSGALPYTGAEVVWAVRHEMARTVEDVLCRRTRALFLNAQAALQAAPKVAALMAHDLECDADWQATQLAAFKRVARHFQVGKEPAARG